MEGNTAHNDQLVAATNDDAQISKLSCIQLGYFEDPFLKFFVKKQTRRSPLINRGYYSRTAALRLLLTQFLKQFHGPQQPCQVLVLGAGFDTTYFLLKEQGLQPRRYIEVDFADVTRRKLGAIAGSPALTQLIDHEGLEGQADEGRLHSSDYHVLPCDLRDLVGLEGALQGAGWDPSLPTYILSECVLVYMEAQHSAALLQWLAKQCQQAVVVIYEQIKPDDAFGRQMVMNLESRGCPLKGLSATPTLQAHVQRLLAAGWQRAEAKDMDTIYRHHIEPRDKQRMERLELFDEFEEWHMIQEHYCITIGINDAAGTLAAFSFPEYKLVKAIHLPNAD